MPPKLHAKDGILGHKGGGHCGSSTQHLGRKIDGSVVGAVQQPARYPTGRVAMAEIIMYRRDSGYLIQKDPFYPLCQEIGSDLAHEHEFCRQRSAVECLQVAEEDFLVMTMTGKLSSSPSIIL